MAALRQYLAEERLEGDNKYHCEFCDAKVDAVRAVRLHRLPRFVNFQPNGSCSTLTRCPGGR